MSYTNNANDDAIAVVASSSDKLSNTENMNYNTFGSNSSLEQQQSLLDNYMPNFGHVHYR